LKKKKKNTDEIFVRGNCPSSKNSQRWTGRYLIKSITTQRYIKDWGWQYKKLAPLFKQLSENKEYPLHVEFKFIRDSRRRFDYINVAQIVCDLMVKNHWIPDDSYRYIIPYFNPKVEVSKEMCGVIIKIIK